jgi:hypothetical protein
MLIGNHRRAARIFTCSCAFFACCVTLDAALGAGQGQAPATIAEQLTTPEHIQQSHWWPTAGKAPRAEYAGSETCGECHDELFKTQKQHAMAKASMPAADSPILRQHVGDAFRLDSYQYKILRDASGNPNFSVTDEGKGSSIPIDWAFGAGKVGQSYLSNRNGIFHEVRFSFFSTLNAFGVTPNQSLRSATSIVKAEGRQLSADEAERCFGCHTTASTASSRLDPEKAIPGVSCESCHGPGATHVSEMKTGDVEAGVAAIFNPKDLKPVELVDFCGACHTTWWDAKGIGATGIANVRFHPYRLESSRCWGKGDARLTCVACHNPHQPLVRELASYDNRCLSCHSSDLNTKPTADHPGSACPVGKRACASCHMPKYEVPDMHYKYTDHRIRVVKNPDLFPD